MPETSSAATSLSPFVPKTPIQIPTVCLGTIPFFSNRINPKNVDVQTSRSRGCPFRAKDFRSNDPPGRCPGLSSHAPLGLNLNPSKTRIRQHDATRSRRLDENAQGQTQRQRVTPDGPALPSRRAIQQLARVPSQERCRLQRPVMGLIVLAANLCDYAEPLHRSCLDRRSSREGRGLGTAGAIGSSARRGGHPMRRVRRIGRLRLSAVMSQVIAATRLTRLFADKPHTKQRSHNRETADAEQRVGSDERHGRGW